MEDSKLYIMIRNLRKQAGKSQEYIAEKLNVNPQAVKAWESYHPKTRSSPKLENLLAMCDLFGCDLDYLTGRIQETTHDISFIHEYTGLSEAAIKKISSDKDKAISRFIENPNFVDFINCFGDYCNMLNSIRSYEQFEKGDDDIEIEMDNGKKVKLPYSLALSLFQQRLSNSLTSLTQRSMAMRMTELIRMEKKK